MKIERYTSENFYDQRTDEYSVVADDGSAALRVRAVDYGGITVFHSPRSYKGNDLTFDGKRVSDPTNSYTPLDENGRLFVVEVKPPLLDDDERCRAAAMVASAVLNPATAGELLTLPGEVMIRLQAPSA